MILLHRIFDRRQALAVPLLWLASIAAAAPPVSEQVYASHLEALASDAFEGRKPGTDGETKTVEYLVQQFRQLGATPLAGTSFVQPVPLIEVAPRPEPQLSFRTARGVEATTFGKDAVVFTKRQVPAVAIEDSPVVFVGHGVVAPEYGWNDYAGVDMKGKTALILINDPGFATGDETLFRGRALTYYGRWTYKFEEAARQGAAAALIVHENVPAAYGWATVVNSWANPQLDMQAADGRSGRVAIEGWLTQERAAALLATAGQDFEDLKKAASTRGFKPVPLDVRATASVANSLHASNSANVLAAIPGSRRPGEYVFYVAHWDHLGRTQGGEGDQTFNGAVDNATGVAGLLAIADAFRRAPARPERTVVFLAVTAEEQGLLGSEYYVAHPLVPLAQTVAVFNMDALYFGGRTRDVRVVGAGASELEDYLAEEAARRGIVPVPEAQPEKGHFYRSDHFSFAQAGVPALYLKTGIDDLQGGIAAGAAREADYVARRYHQVGDNYAPDAQLGAGLEVVDLLQAIGSRVANDTAFPQWKAGNEFRAARERSRGAQR
ncbi:MAG: M20/M25/M40 family metallo-hydrolase [Steroidobacteraceae bacterium]